MPSIIPDDIFDPIAERFRDQLEQGGQDTRLISNRDLVTRIGDSIKNSGRTNDDIARIHGQGFLDNYLDEKNKPVEGQGIASDALASLRRQAIGLGQIGAGGVGLAADTLGFDSVRDMAMQKAAELQQSAATGPQPTIDDYTDVRFDRPGEVARYAANLVGGALPSIVQSALAFGAGGVAGLAGKELLKKKLKSAISGATQEQVEKLARKKAFQTGAFTGLLTSSGVMGPGEVYSELYPYTQLDPSNEDYIDPGEAREASFIGGGLVAGLDFVSAGKLLSKLTGAGRKVSEGYLKRLLRSLPEGVILEGATEGAQEFVIMASEKYIRQEMEFSDREIEQMINAGIMGAVGGAQFSALGAIKQEPAPVNKIDDAERPSVDASPRPDTDQILGVTEQVGQTKGLEVGEEVSQPTGVTGVIQSIQDGIAVVRETKVDEDGIQTTNDVSIPVEQLAPVIEAPVVEPAVEPAVEAPVVEQTVVEGELQKVSDSDPEPLFDESGNATYKVPEDSYTKELQEVGGVFTPSDQENISSIDKDNAERIYSALYNSSQKEDGITKADTQTRNLADVLANIDPDLSARALGNNKAALKILRQANLLGSNFNWQLPTKRDKVIAEQKELSKKKDKALAREEKITRDGYEVGTKLKRTGDNSVYEIEEIIKDTDNIDRHFTLKLKKYKVNDEGGLELDGDSVELPPTNWRRKAERTSSPRSKGGGGGGGGFRRKVGEDEAIELLESLPESTTDVAFMGPDDKRQSFIKIEQLLPMLKQEGARGKKLRNKIASARKELEVFIKYTKDTGEKAKAQVAAYIEVDRGSDDGKTPFLTSITLGDKESASTFAEISLYEEINNIRDFTSVGQIPKEIEIDRVYFSDEDSFRKNFDGQFSDFRDSADVRKAVTAGKHNKKALGIFRKEKAPTPTSQAIENSFRIVSLGETNQGYITTYSHVAPQTGYQDNRYHQMRQLTRSKGYELVGFITKIKESPVDLDIYYENSQQLHDDLIRGGYVIKDNQPLKKEELPAHVAPITEEGYVKDGNPETTTYETSLRENRVIERSRAMDGFDQATQEYTEDVVSKEIKEFQDADQGDADLELQPWNDPSGLEKEGSVFYPNGDRAESPVHKVQIGDQDFYITWVQEMNSTDKTWYRYGDVDKSIGNPYNVRSDYEIQANTKPELIELLKKETTDTKGLYTLASKIDEKYKLGVKRDLEVDIKKAIGAQGNTIDQLEFMRDKQNELIPIIRNKISDLIKLDTIQKGKKEIRYGWEKKGGGAFEYDKAYTDNWNKIERLRNKGTGSNVRSSDFGPSAQKQKFKDHPVDIIERQLKKSPDAGGYKHYTALVSHFSKVFRHNVLLEELKGALRFDITNISGNLKTAEQQSQVFGSAKSEELSKLIQDSGIIDAKGGEGNSAVPISIINEFRRWVKDPSRGEIELEYALAPILVSPKGKLDFKLHYFTRGGYLTSLGNNDILIEELAQSYKDSQPPDQVTPSLIDEARNNQSKAVALLSIKLQEQAIPLKEVQFLTKAITNAGTVSMQKGAGKQASGKQGRDKVLDDDPVAIMQEVEPINVDKVGRDKAIARAYEEFKKEFGDDTSAADVFRRITGAARADPTTITAGGQEVENSTAGSNYLNENISQVTTEPGLRHSLVPMVPNLTDLSTGKEIQIIPTPSDPESIDIAEQITRDSGDKLIANEENPLITAGQSELVNLAKGAIQRFIGTGNGKGTFNAEYVLGNIINGVTQDYQNGDALTFWASMLRGNKSLSKIRVRFLPWSEFRKYARVSEKSVSAGVYLPGRNEIIVTDTFYADPSQEVSADERLANILVHELTHVPVRLGMEIGYAYDSQDETIKRELIDMGLPVDGEALAKIYRDVRDTIIPKLKDINSEFGVNVREYSLSSVEEFFAELSSNYELRHLLKKARITPEMSKSLSIKHGMFKTVWQWLRRVISRIIGVETSMLDVADNYMKYIVKTANPLAKYMGELPFDQSYRMQQMLMDFDPKAEEAPSDLPTFWSLYKINKNGPKVYDQVADVLIYRGDESQDAQTAFDYGTKLNLNVKKLRLAMQRAQARYKRSLGGRYQQIELPTNSDISLQELKDYRSQILDEYSSIFSEEDTVSDVSEIIGNPKSNIPSKMRGLLRALQRDDYFGFDYPWQAIGALLGEDDAFSLFDVSPATKAAITRYITPATPVTPVMKSKLILRKKQPKLLAQDVRGRWHSKAIHVTYLDNIDSIAETGLEPRLGEDGRKGVFFLNPHDLYSWIGNEGRANGYRRNVNAIVSQSGGEGRGPNFNVDDFVNNSGRKKVVLGFSPDLVYSEEDTAMAGYFSEELDRGNIARITEEQIKASDLFVWVNARDGNITGTTQEVGQKHQWVPLSEYVNWRDQDPGARYSQIEMPDAETPTTNSRVPKGNAHQDAAAQVFTEGRVAANNELVEQMTRVYKLLAESNSLPDQFKGKEGLKDFVHFFGIDVGKNLAHFSKLLEKDISELTQMKITDQGMNRRGKDQAMITAVQFLSNARMKARQKGKDLADEMKTAIAMLAEFDRMLANARKKKLTPPKDLAEALAGNMKNKMNLPQIQKLLEQMGIEGMDVTVEQLKKVREMEGLSSNVGDAIEAVIEMGDSVELMSAKEIVDRINGSTDERFAWLKDNPYALYAFADRTVHNRDIYALYRIATHAPLSAKETFFEDVEAIASATDSIAAEAAFKNSKTKGRVATHLEQLKDAKVRALKIKGNNEANLQYKKVYKMIDGELISRESRLRTALGELAPVDIRNGVTMKVAVRKKDKAGNIITSGPVNSRFELDEFTIRYQNGKMVDKDRFVNLHSQTMAFLKDKEAKELYQNEVWFDAMREQANRAMYEPVGDQYFTIRKQAWMAGIESLNARLNRLGFEGKKLAGMLSRSAALFRDLNSDVQYYAKKWNVSYLNLMDKLDIDGKELFTGFYQDMWWWLDNNPQYEGNEKAAMGALWKYLRENGSVPNRTKLNAEAKKAMATLIQRTVAARDFEAEYNFKTLGNRIKDDFSVQSLVDGEMIDFYRRPVDLGYATIPRVLNEGAISKAISVLKAPTAEKNNFKGKWVPSKSNDEGIVKRLRQLDTNQMDVMRRAVDELFTDDVVDVWASNYLKGDNRRVTFYGLDGLEMANSYVNASWRSAQRESRTSSEAFVKFLDDVFNENAEDGATDQDRADWYLSMINQFQNKYDHLHRAYVEIIDQTDQNAVHNMLMNSPRSLDARNISATLPKEYFMYDSYDEVTSAVRLQMMIATSVFGRGGSNANALRGQAAERMEADKQTFLSVISEATNSDPKGVQSDYNKSTRKRAYNVLRQRPQILDGRTPEQAFEDLFANAAAAGELEVIFDHLNKYYGSGNVAGPFKDANLPLEILGLQSLNVLNNPKSSFWQGLSMTEFPMAYHGLNGMAIKATGKAFMTFIDQTFGGMLEAMGMNIGNSHIYSQYLANTHFQNSESDLTWKEYQSQVGTGGELTGFGMDSATAKRGVRFMKNISMHRRKDKKKGLRAPIDFMTPLTGLFPYINSNINHAVGVGAIFSVESEVLKIAKVIEEQGLKNFHNFTAEELGRGAGAFEFFIGDKDGFNQMNNLLEGSGVPNLSRLAFDFIQRKKDDPNTPVIEARIGKLINQMAMSEVAGEGFNAKPAALYTNSALKYFGIFLGWPLWKMARDNRVIQGNSNYVFGKDARTDRATWMAFLKYLGLVSAVYAPAGLSFAMLVDWYDDEILEKPNNLPPISPWAALPVLGPFMAAEADPNFSIYAITSRLAKSGVPYGMGMDLANSVFSKGDPYGAAKDFSLDSRIFAWSMIKNVYDAMGNWMHQGEIDYQNVTRPILYGLGGNSAIQFIDAATAMLDIDIEERRMADYIGIRNIIKKYAWGMNLPLRAPVKGGHRPTSFSINLRQMERAAYNYDTVDFRDAYQEALEAAREDGKADPEREVRNAFKRRMITKNITDTSMTDETFNQLLDIMDPEDSEKVRRYLAAHDQYLKMIDVSTPTKTDEAARLYNLYGIMPDRVPRARRQVPDPRLIAIMNE